MSAIERFAARVARKNAIRALDEGLDPSMLLPDGKTDVRAVSRAQRRSWGWRGPIWKRAVPTMPRYVRRHLTSADDLKPETPFTRRKRRARARMRRQLVGRGFFS